MSKGFWDLRQRRRQTFMTLCEQTQTMLCAKCFALFVPLRSGDGVRDDYPR